MRRPSFWMSPARGGGAFRLAGAIAAGGVPIGMAGTGGRSFLLAHVSGAAETALAGGLGRTSSAGARTGGAAFAAIISFLLSTKDGGGALTGRVSARVGGGALTGRDDVAAGDDWVSPTLKPYKLPV